MAKNPFSKAKAEKILREDHPTLQDTPISKKQRRLLQYIAGGGKVTRQLTK